MHTTKTQQGGVVEVLLKAGVITPDTLLAGNSGGAWAAVAIAMGMSQADLVKMFMLYSAGVDPEVWAHKAWHGGGGAADARLARVVLR